MTLLQLEQQLKMLLCLHAVCHANTHTNTHWALTLLMAAVDVTLCPIQIYKLLTMHTDSTKKSQQAKT